MLKTANFHELLKERYIATTLDLGVDDHNSQH